MKIPTEATETQFEQQIDPHLSQAKRGSVSEHPRYKIFNYILYKLYPGCQWPALPVEQGPDGHPIMSYQVPYYQFRKWRQDGSRQRLLAASIVSIRGELHVSELKLDGSHRAAKKGAKQSPIKDARKPRRATACRSLREMALLLPQQVALLAIIMIAMHLISSLNTCSLT